MRGFTLVALFARELLVLATEPEYLLSSSATCPNGALHITTYDQCRTAAEALDLVARNPSSTSSEADKPSGCYRGPNPEARLYFNPGGTNTSTAEGVKALCTWKAEPPEDEQLGYLGTCNPDALNTDWDHEHIPVRSLSEVPSTGSLPAHFDARQEWPFCFEVAPRSQGSCGSCWAFATTSVARQRACVQDCKSNGRCDSTNVLSSRHLSVQHIMGCSAPENKNGCNGGFAHTAYAAMDKMAAWESEVPYACGGGNVEDQFEQGSTVSCTSWPWGTDTEEACAAVNGIEGYVDIVSSYQLPLQQDRLEGASASAEDLMAAELVANGPLAVDFCVRINFFGFWGQDPQRVYMEEDGCEHGQIIGGHMVMLVGFGTKQQGGQDVKYWIVQNSWGSSWGDSGFFYLQRGVNLCGIENKASAVEVTVSAEVPPTTTTTNASAQAEAEEEEEEEADADDDGLADWVLPLLIALVVVGCCCWFITGAVLFLEKKKFRQRIRELQLKPMQATPTSLSPPGQQLQPLAAAGAPLGAAPGAAPGMSAEMLGRPSPQAQGAAPWSPQQPPAGGASSSAPVDTNPFRQPPPQFNHQQPRPASASGGSNNNNPFRQQPQQGSQFQPAPRSATGTGSRAGEGVYENDEPQIHSARGSNKAASKEAAPPWWTKEPEAYNDNATQRMEEERRKNMY